jgi:hypothetical protein
LCLYRPAATAHRSAEKAHVDLTALTQVRGDLGVVTSRGGNTGAGNTLSVPDGVVFCKFHARPAAAARHALHPDELQPRLKIVK